MPVSQRLQLPPTITSLFEPAKTKLSYDELVVAAKNVKASYSVTEEETRNLEEATRLQARCKLWEVHRAGRVTASNLRATVHTNANNPSRSLIKRICYPEACKCVSTATAWGCQHEVDAVQDFLDGFFLEHSDVNFDNCGLVVNPKYPFMGASPDGIITCSCHGKSLIEVKCPYNCSKQLFADLEGNKGFCLKQINEKFQLDKAHSYYYQMQCQLNICELDTCYFVVWSPEEMHVEVKRDSEFFSALLPEVDNFIINGILPEVTAHWFTQQALTALTDNGDTTDVPDSSEVPCTSNSHTNTNDSKEVYCVYNGQYDGRRMVLCENEHCSSGTWFHFECLNIIRKPQGKWFCPDCKIKK